MTAKLIGVRETERRLRALAAEHPKEAAGALTRTAKRIETRVRRDVARGSNVPQKVIRGRVKSYAASALTLMAKVWVGIGRRIRLAEIPGARFNLRTGVLRAGQATARPFKARLRNGRFALMVRAPGSSHYGPDGELRERPDGQPTELPIEEPVIRLSDNLVRESLDRHAREQLKTYFPAELGRRITLTAARLARR